ncbi:hypothetical protein MCOR14_009560 [Pyricularia oryzae]|nr:hypothetical protein MCOR30_000235 [Pyricularia oryzae]KAI6621417.1 hypothetical protein MCOR08_008427 [Pyricularia oryzae]KAI6623361.1 hypothetical protein MCOR14_009560 [Pyricularia oryzae]
METDQGPPAMCAVLEPPGPSTGKLSKVGRTLDSHSIFTVAKQNQNDAGNDDISTLVALLSEAPASPVLSLYLKLSSGMTPTSRLSWNPPSAPHLHHFYHEAVEAHRGFK